MQAAKIAKNNRDSSFTSEDQMKKTGIFEKTKALDEEYSQFIGEFDQDEAEAIWSKQSAEFRDFWDRKLSSGKPVDKEDLNRVVQFLDSQAKGIGDSDADPACHPVIPQGAWYRIFEEFGKNKKLYSLVSSILKCESGDQQIELLNQLYSGNKEKNRLTGRQANMINDLIFVYNPARNLSVVSLSSRFIIIDAFNLGNSSQMRNKSWGEQIVFSKNAILKLLEIYPFKNFRALSKFFYRPGVQVLWRGEETLSLEDAEFDGKLEDEGFFDIPVGDRKILTEASDPPIKSLCERIDKGKLIAQAEFQRLYIWDTKPKLKSRLIESVLLQVPIPVIYTAEQEDGKELVVDGQQRLLTFHAFIRRNSFKLNSLRVLKELNGKSYKDLDEKLQDALNDYPIRVIKIRKESHKDIKFDIFERLNRGSVSLTEQELRNCMYRGSFNDLLKLLAESKDFQRLQGLSDVQKRMLDRERILRFFAFSDLTYLKYKSPLTSFLNGYMDTHREISEKQKEDKISIFKKSVELCQTVFGDTAFRRWTAGDEEDPNGYREDKINEGLIDLQMYGFTQYEKRDVVLRAMAIKDAFIELMTKDQDFIASIEKGTYGTSQVQLRTERWFSRLREILGYSANERRLYTFEEKKALFENSRLCYLCRNEIAFIEDAHVDHLERYSEGGRTSIKNGKLSHRYCNLQKG